MSPLNDAGDVCGLHPFTAHGVDVHRSHVPRLMAQSPVMLTTPLAPLRRLRWRACSTS